MDSKSKYVQLLKYVITWILVIIVLGLIQKIILLYFPDHMNSITALFYIFTSIKTILILLIIAILCYIIYQSSRYFNSKFYLVYRINYFEALTQGILDMHLVYDPVSNISNVKDIETDFQKRIISFTLNNKRFSLLFMDLYGKIMGSPGWDFWMIQGRKINKDGRVTYQHRAKFENPINDLNNHITKSKSLNNLEHKGFVVISGFYQLSFKTEKIIAPYEISTAIKK